MIHGTRGQETRIADRPALRRVQPSSPVADMSPFPDLGIHQKAEPERLQHPEDEALPAVETTKPDEVPIEEQRKGTHEKRHAVVLLAQVALALHRISACVRLNAAFPAGRGKFSHFA